MACFPTLGDQDENIEIALDVARNLLDLGKDALTLSPIPGLDVAAGALSFLIDRIQITRGNTKTRAELATQIKELAKTINYAHEKSISTVNSFQAAHRQELEKKLRESSDLQERVDGLVSTLRQVGEEADGLSKRGFFFRCLRSTQDAQALTDFSDRIKRAKDDFTLQSQIAVEQIVTDLSNQIAQIKTTVERIDIQMTLNRDEAVLSELASVEASYRSEYNRSKSHYLAGTRAAILEELERWARADDPSLSNFSIYILSGSAGTGKSTIAYEIARRLEHDKLLGASFFFVRGVDKLSTTRFVLPTLAFQLARNRPELYHYVVEAARAHLGLGHRQQLEFQLEDLLIKPLKGLAPDHSPLVVIIDAVDECTESAQDEVAHLLFLLMKGIRRMTFRRIRILITTRPELHIENALSSHEFRDIAKPFKLQDVPRGEVNADISQYLEEGIIHYKYKEQLIAKRPNAVEELTKRAEGLFIYASTARDFIFRNADRPDDVARNIDRLLDETSEPVIRSVTGKLDKLYLAVLDQAFPDYVLERPHFKEQIQDVLGSIALLQDQLSPRTLELLVGVPVDKTKDMLSRLASVVVVSDDPDTVIRPVHASFPQFLIDSARCPNALFFIDPLTHHHKFASICLAMLGKPRTLRENMQAPIPAQVQYACLYWATHLALSPVTPDLLISLREFLTTKLLLWFKALSTMKRLDAAAPALFRVRTWLQAHLDVVKSLDTDKKINTLAYDGYRFILEYFLPIETNPEHIYRSALPSMPACMLQDLYSSHYDRQSTLRLTTERDSQWGPCLRAMEGHTGRVASVKYSPDGRFIVSGAWDNTVRTWRADSGTALMIMRGHEDSVEAVDFSPDPNRRQIVSGSSDCTLRIWDFASGATLHRTDVKRGNVFAVAYSPDGTKIVSGSYNRALHVWSATTGKRLLKREGNYSCINSVAFSRDGDLVVTASSDNIVRVWDTHTGDMIHALRGHSDQAKDAAFYPDGKRVASGASDQTVRIWDVEAGSCTKVLKGHSGRVFAIAVSPNGDVVASGSGDSDPTIRLWDAESGHLLNVLKDHNSWVESLCFAPDGRTLASASDDHMVRIWDVAEHSPGARRTVGHQFAITCLVFSLDGTFVATGSDDKSVAIWETKTGKRLHLLKKHTDRVQAVAFSPDRQRLASAGWDNDIRIWDVNTGELWQTLHGHSKGVEALAYSPDGRWLASGANNLEPTVRIWRASDGELEKVLNVDFRGEPVDMIKSLEFSPDSQMIHTETINGLLYIWDMASGDVLDEFENRWELGPSKAQFEEKDGWILDKRSNKELCWIAGAKRGREGTCASWGNYYATGAGSGQLTIMDLSELID